MATSEINEWIEKTHVQLGVDDYLALEPWAPDTAKVVWHRAGKLDRWIGFADFSDADEHHVADVISLDSDLFYARVRHLPAGLRMLLTAVQRDDEDLEDRMVDAIIERGQDRAEEIAAEVIGRLPADYNDGNGSWFRNS